LRVGSAQDVVAFRQNIPCMSSRARLLAGILTGCLIAGAAGAVHANGIDVIGHSGSGSRSITGRLFTPTGFGAAGVCVVAFASKNEDPTLARHPLWEADGFTARDGTFALRNMVPGDYKLRFGPCNWNYPTRLLGTWYSGSFSLSVAYDYAATVVVAYDEDTTGIRATVPGI